MPPQAERRGRSLRAGRGRQGDRDGAGVDTRIGASSTRGQTCRYGDTGQRSVSADRVSEIWYRRRRDRGALEEPDHVDRDRGATGSGRFEADVGSKP